MIKTLVFLFLFDGIIDSFPQMQNNSLDSLINNALQISPKFKMLNAKYDVSERSVISDTSPPTAYSNTLYLNNSNLLI